MTNYKLSTQQLKHALSHSSRKSIVAIAVCTRFDVTEYHIDVLLLLHVGPEVVGLERKCLVLATSHNYFACLVNVPRPVIVLAVLQVVVEFVAYQEVSNLKLSLWSSSSHMKHFGFPPPPPLPPL